MDNKYRKGRRRPVSESGRRWRNYLALHRRRRATLRKALSKATNPVIQRMLVKDLGWNEKVFMESVEKGDVKITGLMLEELKKVIVEEDMERRRSVVVEATVLRE